MIVLFFSFYIKIMYVFSVYANRINTIILNSLFRLSKLIKTLLTAYIAFMGLM